MFCNSKFREKLNSNGSWIDMPISQNDFNVCFVIENLEKNWIQMVHELKICPICVCFVIQHLKDNLSRHINIIHIFKMILVFVLSKFREKAIWEDIGMITTWFCFHPVSLCAGKCHRTDLPGGNQIVSLGWILWNWANQEVHLLQLSPEFCSRMAVLK